MATSGNYDFRHLRNHDSMHEHFPASCIGTQASFTKIKLSAPLTLAGATDDTKYLVIEDDAGNVFTTGLLVAWFGLAVGLEMCRQKLRVIRESSPLSSRLYLLQNTVSSYNVQDLMLQFYSQRATWSLKATLTA